jgi:hypothetical protein
VLALNCSFGWRVLAIQVSGAEAAGQTDEAASRIRPQGASAQLIADDFDWRSQNLS